MSHRQIILAVVLGLILLIVPTGVELAIGQAGRQQNVQESRSACVRAVPRNAAAINYIRSVGGVKANTYALVLDAQTDQTAWTLLDYPTDQRAVRYGLDGQPPFRCDHAFPPARFLP